MCILRSGEKKMRNPPTDHVPKWKDEEHLRRNSQVTLDTAIHDFNSGQFKTRMKNQIDFSAQGNRSGQHNCVHELKE